MVQATLRFVFCLALKIVEEELAERANRPKEWPCCPECGAKLHSKGFVERKMGTLFGIVCWKRKVGRCPNGCRIGQIAPLDRDLGILPNQACSFELVSLGCLLAVFVPYGIASLILCRFVPFPISPATIWLWVQQYGTIAIGRLREELDSLASGSTPEAEGMTRRAALAPMVVGADGVMVPFRPDHGNPRGRTVWKEVKVGILARISRFFNRKNEPVSRLEQRRLVAVLGHVDELKPRLLLECLKQGILHARTVVWISDGGRGFWEIFSSCFSSLATGILDFYHAAQYLWKGAAACLDGRTKESRRWFADARRQLRRGRIASVLQSLKSMALEKQLSGEDSKTVGNLCEYLETHREHTLYDEFKVRGLPIGSGLVESACKWLIQQRFKGTGMRWSEDGFNNLLHLRLAWVNGRFDKIFDPETYSPKL